jgi:hypothetical protein
MASGASQVDKSTFSEHEDSVSIGELVSVALGLDVLSLNSWVVLKSLHVEFIVEVTNVANDGVVLHLSHVVGHNDALVSSGSHINVSFLED